MLPLKKRMKLMKRKLKDARVDEERSKLRELM